MLRAIYAECHIEAVYAECHNAECHYAECHYAECIGAEKPQLPYFVSTQWKMF
jgi:hypothetical protein